MDLFSISEEETQSSKKLHHAYMQGFLPKHCLPKGTLVKLPPHPVFDCEKVKKNKGLISFLRGENTKVKRLLAFQDEFIYVFVSKKQGLLVKGVWQLPRLINVELSKQDSNLITLVFANKSLNPLDELQRKTFRVPEFGWFLQKLKTQLAGCDIDFELNT